MVRKDLEPISYAENDSAVLGRPANAFGYLRRQGPANLLKEIHHRFYAAYHERKFNVSTAGWIQPAELGVVSPDALPYGPIGYQHIFWAFRKIPFPAEEVVFMDYGCGKGRAVIAAASMPFKRVIGV